MPWAVDGMLLRRFFFFDDKNLPQAYTLTITTPPPFFEPLPPVTPQWSRNTAAVIDRSGNNPNRRDPLFSAVESAVVLPGPDRRREWSMGILRKDPTNARQLLINNVQVNPPQSTTTVPGTVYYMGKPRRQFLRLFVAESRRAKPCILCLPSRLRIRGDTLGWNG